MPCGPSQLQEMCPSAPYLRLVTAGDRHSSFHNPPMCHAIQPLRFRPEPPIATLPLCISVGAGALQWILGCIQELSSPPPTASNTAAPWG